MLKKGSQGAEVKELQNKLVQLGFDLDVDGIFGAATETVVTKLQSGFNYTVDGIVGKGTAGLIDAQIGYGWNAKEKDAWDKASAANPAAKK